MPYLADVDFMDYYDYVIPAPGTLRHLYKSLAPWGAADLAGTQFRYILISGSVAGGRGVDSEVTYGGYTLDQLKSMSYEEVAAAFQIPENGSNLP
jgi:hypothetical protein